MIIQRGRAKEEIYKKEVRKRWMGILDYSEGGTHKNFIQAKIQNEINFKENQNGKCRSNHGPN
jgi:hypothetical protein